MRKFHSSIKATGFILVVLTAASFAQAQTRTWVSGVGDDANPCSRTAPCKTFAGAISKTASGGEIDALDPGGFGAVNITKSITIDGGGGPVASILPGVGASAVNISTANINVTLRNIELAGVTTGATGVSVSAASGVVLHLENVAISSFTGLGVDFEPTAGGTANQLFMINTTVRNNAGGGILIANASALLDNVRSDFNGYGVKAIDGARVSVRDSDASGNTNIGFVAKGTAASAEMNIADSTSSNNGSNGIHSASAGQPTIVRVSNVTVTNNAGIGLANSGGGQLLSFSQGGQGTNNVAGNTGGDGAPTGTLPRQ